jgi:hypothetical protein
MAPSTKVRKRAAGVSARLEQLTADAARAHEALEVALKTGNADSIIAAKKELETVEAARASLVPIVERFSREAAAAESEETREATLRRMAQTATEATAGLERIGTLVPEIHAAFLTAVQKLVAEFRQEQQLRSTFLADARSLGAPLNSDTAEHRAAQEALFDELRSRCADLSAVLSSWTQSNSAYDHPPALPEIYPLGRLIYEAVRELSYREATEGQQEEDEAA